MWVGVISLLFVHCRDTEIRFISSNELHLRVTINMLYATFNTYYLLYIWPNPTLPQCPDPSVRSQTLLFFKNVKLILKSWWVCSKKFYSSTTIVGVHAILSVISVHTTQIEAVWPHNLYLPPAAHLLVVRNKTL